MYYDKTMKPWLLELHYWNNSIILWYAMNKNNTVMHIEQHYGSHKTTNDYHEPWTRNLI